MALDFWPILDPGMVIGFSASWVITEGEKVVRAWVGLLYIFAFDFNT